MGLEENDSSGVLRIAAGFEGGKVMLQAAMKLISQVVDWCGETERKKGMVS